MVAAPTIPLGAPNLDEISAWLCEWVDVASVNITKYLCGPEFTSELKSEIKEARENASGLFDSVSDWYKELSILVTGARLSAVTAEEAALCDLVVSLAGFMNEYHESTDKTAAYDNLLQFLSDISNDTRNLGKGIVDTSANIADAADSPLGYVAAALLVGLFSFAGLKKAGIL